jgi:hypothetical protein
MTTDTKEVLSRASDSAEDRLKAIGKIVCRHAKIATFATGDHDIDEYTDQGLLKEDVVALMQAAYDAGYIRGCSDTKVNDGISRACNDPRWGL